MKNNKPMQDIKTKQPYLPPRLDLYLYEVEHGFQGSPTATQLDNISETQEQTEFGTYENYTGEWF